MEESTPNRTKLIIGIIVALVAVGALVAAYLYYPKSTEKTGSNDFKGIPKTEEEKIQLLEQLRTTANNGPALTTEEKLDMLEKLSNGSGSVGTSSGTQKTSDSTGKTLSNEEKLKLLESLRQQ